MSRARRKIGDPVIICKGEHRGERGVILEHVPESRTYHLEVEFSEEPIPYRYDDVRSVKESDE